MDTLARQRQLIGGTAEWAANDLVIGDGEIAVERVSASEIKIKIGDGTRRFSALPYASGSSAGAAAGSLPLTGGTLTGNLNGTTASFTGAVTLPAGVAPTANQAVSRAEGDKVYMPKTGGAFTGGITGTTASFSGAVTVLSGTPPTANQVVTRSEGDKIYVNVSGDTMTGVLNLLAGAAPTGNNAVSRTEGDKLYLRQTGGTLTGPLVLPAMTPTGNQALSVTEADKLYPRLTAVAGGMMFKGAIDVTGAAPATPNRGDYYAALADVTIAASWAGVAGQAVRKGDLLLFDGTNWHSIAQEADLTKYLPLTGGTLSGNLVIGATPIGWNSALRALQFGMGSLYGNPGGAHDFTLTANSYLDSGAAFRYVASGYASEYRQSEGKHVWKTAPSGTAGNVVSFTQAMTLDADGKLFLGTTSGAAGFNLITGNNSWWTIGASSTSESYGTFYKGGTTTAVGHIGTDGGGIVGSGSGDNFGIRAEGALLLMSGGSERARITSSGDFLVGVTNAIDGRLSISANTSNSGCIGTTNNGLSDYDPAYFYHNGSIVGHINCSSSATRYLTSSDARLKENIADAADAAQLIDAIQVRQFDWKIDGSRQRYGMVAQELEQVFPEAVSKHDDANRMMGVDYSKLVPMLIKEIQSIRARMAALEGQPSITPGLKPEA